MTTLVQQIADSYQGSAPQKVVNAVAKAAAATGADFSELMEKASTESGFNPTAKSSTSSATGLFQFIDSTWLSMVKEHGSQMGLGNYAAQIQMKDGKPCVTDCTVKKEILALRKNPEISAMMAGMASADDQNYLENHTDGNVGKTEMYLAHFMGANGASKFLNARADNGSASAASVFPKEAHANKSIFYTSSGHARSLDQVYNILARKIDGTENASTDNGTDNGTIGQSPLAGSDTTAPASSTYAPSTTTTGGSLPLSMMAQALPSSSDDDQADANGIVWDTPAVSHGGFSSASASYIASQKLSSDSLMMLEQTQHQQHTASNGGKKQHYNA
jgi:hypothetical protein